LLSFTCLNTVTGQISIDTSFEGSNAKLVEADQENNIITIRSVKRKGDTFNLWFYFGVSGFDLQKPLTIFVEGSSSKFLPALAAYSYNTHDWERVAGVFMDDSMMYKFTPTKEKVYFSMGYPYLNSKILDLENEFKNNRFVRVSDLTRSEAGRTIKLFRITDDETMDKGKALIWVICRNHAFESHSNYVIEGLIKYLASEDEKAHKLRKNAIVYVVPIMDVDMVEKGDSGKDQKPSDFNRNWEMSNHWNAVEAVKKKISETAAENRLRIFIDSHNPFPGSKESSHRGFFYTVNNENLLKSQKIDLFRELLKKNGGYSFDRKPFYPTEGMTATGYVDSIYPEIDISTAMETGWVQRTDGAQWTIPLYYLHGEVLGKGLSDFINYSRNFFKRANNE